LHAGLSPKDLRLKDLIHIDLLPDHFNVEPSHVDSLRRGGLTGTAATVGRINRAATEGRIRIVATVGRIRIEVTEGRIHIVVIDMEGIPIVVTGTEVIDTEGIHIGAMEDIHTMVRIFIIAEASGWIRDGF
jgi:sporulation protein YlmC with PRC-barrel domain